MNRQERAEFAARIAARFKELKEAQGMTQQELADAADMSPRGVAYFLNGDRVPKDDTLRKLAAAVGIEYDAAEQRTKIPERDQAFLDVVALWFSTLSDAEREDVKREWMERMVRG